MFKKKTMYQIKKNTMLKLNKKYKIVYPFNQNY